MSARNRGEINRRRWFPGWRVPNVVAGFARRSAKIRAPAHDGAALMAMTPEEFIANGGVPPPEGGAGGLCDAHPITILDR
jgi:hypothetical protein